MEKLKEEKENVKEKEKVKEEKVNEKEKKEKVMK